MMRILIGLAIGLICVPIAAFSWLHFGQVPVAVADKPLPQEGLLTHIPLEERIDREMVKTPPVQADEATVVAGAHIYADQCAVCHGYYGRAAPLGKNMYPDAPPLWEKHPDGEVVGVSDDPPGETYWKVANGIRLSGMPSFKQILTENEMWQVSILLKNADKPLSARVLNALRGNPPLSDSAATPVTPPASAPH